MFERYYSDDLPLPCELEDELAEQEFRELQDWQDLQASIPDAAERNRNLR
jgi:hypothetical protein|tara:strand:- start:467 stop:616 length:150 start_codon:yes stop_codon:yes gene_type:complete